MAEGILKILSSRNDYIDQLDKEISENIKIIEESEKECKEISSLMENIKLLGAYPEQEALIPLSKNFFMKGKIIHTGEHHVYKPAHPDSYVFLKTCGQTLDNLNNMVKQMEKDIEKAKYSQFQLEERKKILFGDQDLSTEETENIPSKILSDKGVAVKVGDFYEIIEYEDSV